MSSIDCVLFDLGETLLHFGSVQIPPLFEAGSQLAYQYLKDLGFDLPEFRRYHKKKLFAIRWNYFLSTITGREMDALVILDRLHRRIGVKLSEAQTLELASLWYEPLSRRARIEPTAIQTLTELTEMGIRLGLVSNTFVPAEVLDRHLAREKLLDLLPVRVYSCQVGLRKPRRAVFQAALDKLGARAASTVFVGDSPKADVYGANRMGMVSVLLAPGDRRRTGRYRPRHTIRRLAELPDIVRANNNAASGS
ncbi:MAG: HAD family hydrolase [Planctomycetes bacterium]|jgi:putative hydrolase of the HAD superfamily|nr:HAD family hydrolase [Planctomycetota bacterium]